MSELVANPSSPEGTPKRWRAWLQLVRVPNLLTVPGDVAAGACLAASAGSGLSPVSVLMAMIASVAVYAAGLVDNDLVDEAEDRADRPGRPLACGAVSRRAARVARLLLFLVPYVCLLTGRLSLWWAGVHLCLLAACLGYNRVKAVHPVLATGLMGGCRALNLLSGVVVVWRPGEEASPLWILIVAVIWGLYVTGITLFAAGEVRRVPGRARFLLCLVPLLLPGAGLPRVPAPAVVALWLTGATGALLVWDVVRRLGPGSPATAVPPLVGRLVRALVPMQALLCLACPCGVAFALGLLVCWLFAERLGRWFYAS